MRCEGARHHAGMAKIILVQFRPSRLPQRLLNDGWWLETKLVRSRVIAFPTRRPPAPEPGYHSQRRHLTLVPSENDHVDRNHHRP
jgi:hypothetical protein